MLRPSPAADRKAAKASSARSASRPSRQAFKAPDLLGLRLRIGGKEAAVAAGQERRGFACFISIDADHDLLAAFDRLKPLGGAFDQPLLHVGIFDRPNGAAQPLDGLEFLARRVLQLVDLRGDRRRPVEDIIELQEIGFIGDDLLQAKRPLLIPGPRQSQSLVPGRQLHGPGTGRFGKRNGQHFQEDAIDVVFRLLFGQTQRIHLNAIAESAILFLLNTITLAADFIPKLAKGPHLANFGDETKARVHEEGNAAHDLGKGRVGHLAGGLDRVEHGNGRRQRIGQFLNRRGTGFLQMIGTNIGRIPARHLFDRKGHHVGNQTQGRLGRKDIGPARKIFLDDVVLRRPRQLVSVQTPVSPPARCRERSSQAAGALMVMEVFMRSSGISAKSSRMSPRWAIGTPTLPTSPRASGWSES